VAPAERQLPPILRPTFGDFQVWILDFGQLCLPAHAWQLERSGLYNPQLALQPTLLKYVWTLEPRYQKDCPMSEQDLAKCAA
jgi:hypothetical protein